MIRTTSLSLCFLLSTSSACSSSCADSRRAVMHVANDESGNAKAEPAAALPKPENVAQKSESEIPKIAFEAVGKGFEQITDLQFFPGSDTHAFVTQKDGKVSLAIFENLKGLLSLKSKTLLFSRDVRTKSEMGVLGVAFHNDFMKNGRFFINCNPLESKKFSTAIEEWRFDHKTQKANPEQTLLTFEQPYQNHNGGQLLFGKDGYLYIATGDGGWADDPHGAGQNLDTLLGKILRIDVDQKGQNKPYAIPKDNPFVGAKSARPEIYAYGLRNPWRFSFLDSGDLIVADVGQNLYEEVNVVKKGDNLGWKVREGFHCFEPKKDCKSEGLVDPVFEYDHKEGKSITGGYVYRGSTLPGLKNKYVVADFVTGRFWALTLSGQKKAVAQNLGDHRYLTSTFGQNHSGEMFIGDFGSGSILQMVLAK